MNFKIQFPVFKRAWLTTEWFEVTDSDKIPLQTFGCKNNLHIFSQSTLSVCWFASHAAVNQTTNKQPILYFTEAWKNVKTKSLMPANRETANLHHPSAVPQTCQSLRDISLEDLGAHFSALNTVHDSGGSQLIVRMKLLAYPHDCTWQFKSNNVVIHIHQQ